MRSMEPFEAISGILSQTIHKFSNTERLDIMLKLLDKLVEDIPVYEFFNKPEPDAAWMSYLNMSRKAKENGL